MNMRGIERLFKIDQTHSASWRRQAPKDFKFYAAKDTGQWEPDEVQWNMDNERPMITFNRTMSIINTVVGNQIQNRQEVRYLPVEIGDAAANDLWTSAGKWFDSVSMCDVADTQAFRSACICGMGWTETNLSYDENPDGDPSTEFVDALEMYWDASARGPGLRDASRMWRAREMPIGDARALIKSGKKIADSMFDASGWCNIDHSGSDEPKNQDKADRYEDDDTNENDTQRRLPDHVLVTVVHLVIKIREMQTRYIDPESGEEMWLDDERREAMDARMAEMGLQPMQGLSQPRTKFYQYIIGSEILDEGPMLVDEFPYHCITGYQDDDTGLFFGMLRGMRDPQRFANKWVTQITHILNTMAKGGVIAERGAVEDDVQFEQSWAKSDEVTWVNPGGIDRVKPKGEGRVPPELFRMVEYAVQSIRDVPGVNLEMLGQRGAIQANSLEQSRKESGLTVLAALFDSMRIYRLRRGRMILEIMKRYLADGRLIRVVGADGAKYVPLMLQTDLRFDVMLDEDPASPDVKERTWQFILPQIAKFPPQVVAELLVFSPLPAAVQEKLAAILMKLAQPDPVNEALRQAEVSTEQADAGLKQASATEKRALARKHLVDARTSVIDTINQTVQGAQQHGEGQQESRNRALSGGDGGPPKSK